MGKYIMVMDQGTTGSRAIIYDSTGTAVSVAYKEFTQIYPQPGWVEHNPEEIWQSSYECCRVALDKLGVTGKDIAAIGITNQRETSTIWDRETGKPVYNALVWADNRTSHIIQPLMEKGLEGTFNDKTGLTLSPVYSASKIRWILDNVDGVKDKLDKLAFGTVDTWLLWNLTKGKVHATDYSNASRTMLFNAYECKWDAELMDIMDIPASLFPEAKPSVGLFGYTDPEWFNGAEIPITGIAGDQQAALFGQACLEAGEGKVTYGTSNVPLMFIGDKPVKSEKGLLTLAWGIDGKVCYSMGASILITGAAVQWLRDGIHIIDSAAQTEEMSKSIPDTAGLYFVPTFTGMAAPHWDMYARGMMIGITASVRREHIARATLESVAYQTRDLLDQMEKDSGVKLTALKVDGGMTKNDFLMQFQADICGCDVIRPADTESTALGCCYMAGLGIGMWKSQDDVKALWKAEKVFHPQMDEETREKLYAGWKRAVDHARGWLKP